MSPTNLLALFLLLLCWCCSRCGSEGCGLRQYSILDDRSSSSNATLIRRCSGSCYRSSDAAAAASDDADDFVAASRRCIPSSTKMREISVPLMLMEEDGVNVEEEEKFSDGAKSDGAVTGSGQR